MVECLENRTLLSSLFNPANLISIVPAGTASGNAGSTAGKLSSDGRFDVFTSNASNLATGVTDGNGTTDVFVRDLLTGMTTMVSLNSTGTASGSSTSDSPVISANGEFVALRSFATNLTSTTTDGNGNIYVRDLVHNTTTLVSINSAGTNGGNNLSDQPSISDDGSVVAWRSFATNLTSDTDSNNTADIYARNWNAASPAHTWSARTPSALPATAPRTSPSSAATAAPSSSAVLTATWWPA